MGKGGKVPEERSTSHSALAAARLRGLARMAFVHAVEHDRDEDVVFGRARPPPGPCPGPGADLQARSEAAPGRPARYAPAFSRCAVSLRFATRCSKAPGALAYQPEAFVRK